MPELPEVETTRRGISPHIVGQRVIQVIIRESRLRWPIPKSLPQQLKGRKLKKVDRRGKYLLLCFRHGALIIHLGMSGSLRIVGAKSAPQKHDHFDLRMSDGKCLRLRDPRRFGAVVWTQTPPCEHTLIKNLGPEPLEDVFDGDYLYACGRHRQITIKQLIMESKTVVGVGNIYANESLFLAGIDPKRASNRIAKSRYHRLAQAIRTVLTAAIAQGGTTLRDFQREDGQPGYFSQALQVYGKADTPCPSCGALIRTKIIAQRTTFYCPACQR
jgi:formamidopyrimidine-DNA glycosylase